MTSGTQGTDVASKIEGATTAAILDALNTYTGDNFWQDVVLGADLDLDVDDDATEAADPTYRSDVFVLADGRTFRHDGDEWVEA